MTPYTPLAETDVAQSPLRETVALTPFHVWFIVKPDTGL
jgi:hypothetical protein